MPFSVMGLLASNSAANEWCARTVPAASTRPTATSPPSMYARMSVLLLLPYCVCRSHAGVVGTLRPVVLAKVDRQRLAANPAHRPAARPGPRVGPGIVHRHLVPHRVQIDPRELLDEA